MNRRIFMDNLGIGSMGLFLVPTMILGCREEKVEVPKSWMETLISENDINVSQMLNHQVNDALSIHFGGLPDQYKIYHPGSAASFIQRLTAAYISPGSAYFHSPHLVVRMQHSMDFLLKRQHEDGTIDLLSTNFHSTPDTGFVVEPLALSYKLLDRDNQQESLEVRISLRQFLSQAGAALKGGGIHTPNHRWVVSMALSRIHELFPDEQYISRIDQWLKEGIDIDGDGQYTERSTAVYSPLTDRCFITMAEILNRQELLEPVRRNLDMTLYYLHPNGELVTEASRRQDQYLAQTPSAYYYPYRYMSIRDQNPGFGAMATLLENNLGGRSLVSSLAYLLEDPSLTQKLPAGEIPTNYQRHFKDSDLVRIRRGMMDATILAKNSTLFTFHHHHSILQAVRMATAFFGKGQFIADEMIVEEGKYLLRQNLEGPYYQPIAEDLIASDGNWEKMPRHQRPKSEIQKIEYTLEIVEVENGFQLDFSIEGTDHVPVAIELSFRRGGSVEGGEPIEQLPDAYFFKSGVLTYEHQGYAIQVQGGLHEHAWTQLRGAEPPIDGVSIYLTGYTPFRHQLLIHGHEAG